MTTATLNINITAEMLAMSAPGWCEGDEGYPPSYVIGPVGSTVQVLDDEEDHWVECSGFANDPFAVGFVLRADLDFA